jgi:secreted PhoX family phosphatase
MIKIRAKVSFLGTTLNVMTKDLQVSFHRSLSKCHERTTTRRECKSHNSLTIDPSLQKTDSSLTHRQAPEGRDEKMLLDRRSFIATGFLATFVSSMERSEAWGAGLASDKSEHSPDRKMPSMGLGDPRRKKAFSPLPYSDKDELSLAEGFTWYSVLKTGDVINSQGDRAGDCCDFLHFMRGKTPDQAFLWVNHEYLLDNVLYGKNLKPQDKTKEQVDAEMKLVGGSYVELKRIAQADGSKRWQVKTDSQLAFRLDANTPIPMVGPAGGKTVLGTLANCSGGFTSWGTILTAEENYDVYFKEHAGTFHSYYGWGEFYPRSEEDYGWVVEVDPTKKSARKLTALGRFAHEGATVTSAKDGRVVVYLGDDAKGQCIYKFISKGKLTGDASKDADLLLDGDLFVANLSKGEWILLSPENPLLSKDERFKSLSNILTHTREAAKLAGGTRLNRPEDIKVDPTNGDVYFALTNNADVGDLYGSVNLLRENGGDAAARKFSFETFLAGGTRSGMSCPDNLTFGPRNTLWACTDMSASAMGKGGLTAFQRNSMFRLETDAAGSVFARHFVQSPRDAELTGPTFLPDGSGLLLSVQHPGEGSFGKEGGGLTSHWPEGGESKPISSVVCIVAKNGKRDPFFV